MPALTVYSYERCQTCKKALQFLKTRRVSFQIKDIVHSPPSVSELATMLDHVSGDLKKLFNTSGQVYRDLKISEKLPHMAEDEALLLLSQNGKLIKRPFLWLGDGRAAVGFKEDAWDELLAEVVPIHQNVVGAGPKAKVKN